MRRSIVPTVLVLSVLFVLVLALVSSQATPPDDPDRQPSSPTEKLFWEVIAANGAWLLPSDRQMNGSLTVQEIERPFGWSEHNLEPAWTPGDRVESWTTRGKSAAWRLWSRDGAGDDSSYHIDREERYAGGKGGEVRIPYKPDDRKLHGSSYWTAATGTTFWTSLHQAAIVDNLPKEVTLTREDGLIRFQATAPPHSRVRADGWDRAFSRWEPPTYHANATMEMGRDLGSLEYFLWELDPVSLRPHRLVERGVTGESVVTFGDDWLETTDGSVPATMHVRFTWANGDQVDEHDFQMQVVDDRWVLHHAASRWVDAAYDDVRTELMQASSSAPAAERFAWPRDVELPEKSWTELGPGQRIVHFTTTDGLELEGKLSLPPEAKGPVPVVMYLPGSGPWTFDRTIPCPTGMMQFTPMRYLDLFQQQLNRRGVGFFAVNKRGCAIADSMPYERVRRSIFGKTTPSVLLDDCACALRTLRSQPDVDSEHIVLLGMSEGTEMAPRLALKQPDGIAGLVLSGYAEDNTHDTIVWQMTVGPWRNVSRFYDLDNDDRVTSDEYAAGKPDMLYAGQFLASGFHMFDADRDGVLTPEDLAKVNKPALNQVITAIESGDDDWLWWNYINLNSAHLKEHWKRGPLHETLLELPPTLPIHIFHGTHDGNCRVEGVYETAEAFKKKNRGNLNIHIDDHGGHNMRYGEFLGALITWAKEQDGVHSDPRNRQPLNYDCSKLPVPQPMAEMFDTAAELAKHGA